MVGEVGEVGEVGGGGWHARLVPTCQNFIDTSQNGQLFSLPDDASRRLLIKLFENSCP